MIAWGRVTVHVFFVCVVCEHRVTVKLWTSKCRLAPVKEILIPRLELLACFLLSKLIASVKTATESEVEIVKSVLLDGFANCVVVDMGKCIKSGRFECRTGSRKFGSMLTAKTGFMYQLH